VNVKTVLIFIADGLGFLFLAWEGLMNSDTLDVTQKSTKSAKLEKHIRPNLRERLHSGSSLIHFSDNQLSLAITQQPLQDVVKAIAQQAKLSIMFDQEMANPNIALTLAIFLFNRVCNDYSRTTIPFTSTAIIRRQLQS
jgi:hypothetical protein